MKILFVGDPHFKHTQKDEMERLMHFVRDSANDHVVDQIVILGDLNDTHGVLRTENLYFWEKWLELLSVHQKLYVLTGNHDKKNQGDDNDFESSLAIFNRMDCPNLHIIQSPATFDNFAYMPYMHDKKRFVDEANRLATQGAKVLVCHGEFDGAAYDNGFFILDGVKQEELNFDLIISGHIHTGSYVGKVWYPGTARWMTSSDANKKKGIWISHFTDQGNMFKEELLDTSHVCTPIYAYQYKEGEAEPIISEGSRASIELIGSSEWISKQKVKFKGKASISSKITDKQKLSNRKTGNNIADFVNNVFEPTKGIKKDKMLNFMKELGII